MPILTEMRINLKLNFTAHETDENQHTEVLLSGDVAELQQNSSRSQHHDYILFQQQHSRLFSTTVSCGHVLPKR